MNPAAKFFFRGRRYEGDFRTTYTRAVLNAEQISTLRGEGAEKELTRRLLQRVDANGKVYYMWQGLLLILRLFFTISIPACSYMCLAITKMTNSTTANFFQKQIGDVFGYILYFPVYIERLAFACGAMHRVGQLLEEMSRFEQAPVRTQVEFDRNCIALRNVTANPPVPLDKNSQSKNNVFGGGTSGRALFERVSLSIKHGESMCIVGPSGCGKSSLLCVIAGLRGVEDGTVIKPSAVGRDGVVFFPQEPYGFPGSWLHQGLYPAVLDDSVDVTRAQECLKVVPLKHLVAKYGLDKSLNWSAALSFSGMQRLNFARMFYHAPSFCLADECTSALDLRLESFLYEQCTAFPTDGLEDVEGEGDLDEGEVEERSEGLNLKLFKRFLELIRLSIGKVSSQVFLIWFLQLAARCIYGGLRIEIFKRYGTSVIVALITGTKPYTLATRNVDLALNKCGIIIALNSVIASCQTFSCLAGARLAVRVQRAGVRRFHAVYFSPGVVYHLNRIMKERGVDQRIVRDLSSLREALAWLFGNPFAYCHYRVGALPLFIVWVILLCHAFNCGWQLSLFMLGFFSVPIIFLTHIASKRVPYPVPLGEGGDASALRFAIFCSDFVSSIAARAIMNLTMQIIINRFG